MNDFWWYLSRATGIVGTALAIAALLMGFFFSARNTGKRRKANWWLDLHNYLGGLSLAVIGVHIVAAYLDTNSGIGVLQVFVPGTASGAEWAIGWGVAATYLFVLTVFTSWPKRHFSRPVWRALHLTSVLGVVFAVLHALQAGSDATEVLFQAGLILAVAVGVYALGVRLFDVVARAASK